MTRKPSPLGSPRSPHHGNGLPTSTPSDAALIPADLLSASAPPSKGPESLYALGIQAQYIDGEIALAAQMLESGDPEAEQTAIELIESFLEASADTKAQLSHKADNICRYIDHLKGQAEFRQTQAKRLADLAAADAKRAEQLQDYMLKVLTTLDPDATGFSLPTHEIRSRKSTSVQITDEQAIPMELLNEKISYTPDKAAIKAAIKAGESVPGCQLITKTNWTIK